MLDPSMFLVPAGAQPRLARVDPASHDGFDGDKDEGEAALDGLTPRLTALQSRLWAEGVPGQGATFYVSLPTVRTP